MNMIQHSNNRHQSTNTTSKWLKLLLYPFFALYWLLDNFGQGLIYFGEYIYKFLNLGFQKFLQISIKLVKVLKLKKNETKGKITTNQKLDNQVSTIISLPDNQDINQEKAINRKPHVFTKNNLISGNFEIDNLLKKKKITNQELLFAIKILIENITKFPNQAQNLSTTTYRNLSTEIFPKFKFIKLLVIFFGVVLTLNTLFLLFESPFKTAKASENQIQSQVGVQTLISETSQPGVRILENFQDTNVVAEVGSHLNIERSRIYPKTSQNCKTPVPPPTENGCDFVVIPSGLAIPLRGTIFQSLRIEATITGESEIIISKKNYETSRPSEEISRFNSINLNTRISLPEVILGTEGLEFKIWEKNGSVEIRKIVFEYFNVNNLSKVSGKILNWEGGPKLIGQIFQDVNQNKKLDERIDKPWSCRAYFPGSMPVNIDEDGGFVIYRDENCFVDVKPDAWYTDEKKTVLPAGDWLMVVNLGSQNKIYSFNIPIDKPEVVLELNDNN